jgi:hypothetical protein
MGFFSRAHSGCAGRWDSSPRNRADFRSSRAEGGENPNRSDFSSEGVFQKPRPESLKGRHRWPLPGRAAPPATGQRCGGRTLAAPSLQALRVRLAAARQRVWWPCSEARARTPELECRTTLVATTDKNAARFVVAWRKRERARADAHRLPSALVHLSIESVGCTARRASIQAY